MQENQIYEESRVMPKPETLKCWREQFPDSLSVNQESWHCLTQKISSEVWLKIIAIDISQSNISRLTYYSNKSRKEISVSSNKTLL